MFVIPNPRRLPFAGFAAALILAFTCLGELFGLSGLIGGLMGMHVFIYLGPLRLEGIPAALFGMVLMPCLFGLAGLVAAIVFYLPARWVASLF
jgi:hypothetical protein